MPLVVVSQETFLRQTDSTFSAGNGCTALAAGVVVIALVSPQGRVIARGMMSQRHLQPLAA